MVQSHIVHVDVHYIYQDEEAELIFQSQSKTFCQGLEAELQQYECISDITVSFQNTITGGQNRPNHKNEVTAMHACTTKIFKEGKYPPPPTPKKGPGSYIRACKTG